MGEVQPGELAIFLVVAGYLAALVAISELADRGGPLARLGRHPAAFGLAMGVYATSFTLFGGVGYAARYGYVILGFYFGVALSCLAIPLLWAPLAALVRRFRLTSAADLFAFRFPSPVVGPLVSTVLLIGLLPYLSLQLRALEGAAALLGPGGHTWLGPAYVALLAAFVAGLGVRYASPGSDRPGLLATLVVESVFKLGSTLVVGAAALGGVFGGFAGFGRHLDAHPEVVEALLGPVHGRGFVSVVVFSFFGAFLLPRQFHVAFAARPAPGALRHAAWTLPLLLALLLLPLPVLLEAGRTAAPPGTPPDLYVMAWTNAPVLRVVAFLGGVSASSAMVLVSTVALSGMVVTYFALPLRQAPLSTASVRRLRQAVTVTLVLVALAADQALSRLVSLVDLGLVSFAVVGQLGPGVLALLFWPRATGAGFVTGLIGGCVVVFATIARPLLALGTPAEPDSIGLLGSLVANGALLVAVSLATRPSVAERRAALAGRHAAMRPPRTVTELEERIAVGLGPALAAEHVALAMTQVGLAPEEARPQRLRQLVVAVEQRLSEVVGPLRARAAVSGVEDGGLVDVQLTALEEREAGDPRAWLQGLLRDMPDGVVATDAGGEILLWNPMAAAITGRTADDVVGLRLDQLPYPLPRLLSHEQEGTFRLPHGSRTLLTRRRELADGGAIVRITDLTEARRLTAEVEHQARLSSVGRMAAGVAHEIRNPLTGLLMVARNLERELTEPDHRERLSLVVSEGRRIEAIIRSMLTFSRASGAEGRGPVPVGALVEEALGLLRLQPEAHGVRVEAQVDPSLVVEASSGSLVQVVLNLLSNAVDASPPDVAIRVHAAADGDEVTLDVLDAGPGVAEAVRDTLFEPFTTTKPVGQGTGLGLSVSWRIVQSHGGSLTYERDEGWTRFRVRLPRSAGGER